MKVIKTKKTAETAQNRQEEIKGDYDFVFKRENYILMIIGLVFISLGYILMIGGGSDDPNVFSEAIFDTQRLTVAPILLIVGFIIEVFAIMYRKKDKVEIENEDEK
ncbi:MAG: DUF3098 domain-containing protein [Bacteroidales bacterium]|jgi:hypothetical protein